MFRERYLIGNRKRQNARAATSRVRVWYIHFATDPTARLDKSGDSELIWQIASPNALDDRHLSSQCALRQSDHVTS